MIDLVSGRIVSGLGRRCVLGSGVPFGKPKSAPGNASPYVKMGVGSTKY